MLKRSTGVATILQLMQLPLTNTQATTLQCPLNQNLINYERALNLLGAVLRYDLDSASTPVQSETTSNKTKDVLYASNRKLGRGGIDKITLDGAVSTVFDTTAVKGLASASDGTFWATEQEPTSKTDHVMNINKGGDILTEFPSGDEGPRGIAIDDEGVLGDSGLLYVAAKWNGNINQFNQSGDLLNKFSIPTNRIDDISIDSDGYLWYVIPKTNDVYKTELSGRSISVVDHWQPDFGSAPGGSSNDTVRGLAIKGSDLWVTRGAGSSGLFRFSKSGEFQSVVSDVEGRLYLNAPPV